MKIRMMDEVSKDRAEGRIKVGDAYFPFSTELCGPGGCSVVIWIEDNDPALLGEALRKLCGERDIVMAQASRGSPTGYWAAREVL